ncbi:hypothetical protein AVEN_247065-1 [Araneus ventricosus]|uniref:Uncharacterized protein n=1 Tax=Araneus ventricosus TaxID=182803 RepID=A0A4Y2RUF6_ARAVE|nr:hypothetical protein AVEN_98296-1 [Araneus ventricosus]GBN77540.1 hypothetical protein AVEN_16519-1 [Araneus ventricosus]GBN78585.1 hypothetical protein AVEN_215015-1 [Araneus ventricosus]GBN78593.1 hypothetical protein AVEN_247065-1 [Araneus ventricosus]
MFLLHSTEMEFWDDKRNVRTHSYYPMKHSQTVLTINKIQGTRIADILIHYTTTLWVLSSIARETNVYDLATNYSLRCIGCWKFSWLPSKRITFLIACPAVPKHSFERPKGSILVPPVGLGVGLGSAR